MIALLQPPQRFLTKRQLWAYCGLALRTRSSADYRFTAGQLQRSQKPPTLRGLNENHNHELKTLSKATATVAVGGSGPVHDFYAALIGAGKKPAMARLTLARKIAAITLSVWKKGARFDPGQLKRQAAWAPVWTPRGCGLRADAATSRSPAALGFEGEYLVSC